MKVQTTRFGELEVDEKELYTFPEGLLGFGHVKTYLVRDHSKGPFKWLQAVDQPGLAFVVCDPMTFKPDYRVNISKAEMEELKLDKLEDAVVLVVLVVPKDPKQMTANLQGPLVFNPKARIARQLVLQSEEYTTKYRVFQDAGDTAGAGRQG